MYGRSISRGLAHFTVDESQLSLHWSFDASTDQITPLNPHVLFWHTIVVDDESGEYLGWYSYSGSADDYPTEGIETLDLIPDHIYRLYWGIDVPVWAEYGSYSNAILTLDLTEGIQPVPVPNAIFLGVFGLGVAVVKLRRHS